MIDLKDNNKKAVDLRAYVAIKKMRHITTLSFRYNYKCTLRPFYLTHDFLIDHDHIFIDEGLTPCLENKISIYYERGLIK